MEDTREEVEDRARATHSRKESAQEAQAADSLMTVEEVAVSHLCESQQ